MKDYVYHSLADMRPWVVYHTCSPKKGWRPCLWKNAKIYGFMVYGWYCRSSICMQFTGMKVQRYDSSFQSTVLILEPSVHLGRSIISERRQNYNYAVFSTSALKPTCKLHNITQDWW